MFAIISLVLLCLIVSNQVNCEADFVCNNLKSEEKTDCHPDQNVSEDACVNRGCCWSPGSDIGVPICYFPTNYPSYEASSIQETKTGYVIQLIKPNPMYDKVNEIKQIEMNVNFETPERLRIRIVIPSQSGRWEPPIPLGLPTYPQDFKPDDLQYAIDLKKSPFGIKVSRKDNAQDVLIDSGENLSSNLIITDQFLQMTFRMFSRYGFGIGETENMFPLLLNSSWIRLGLWGHDGIPGYQRNLYGVHNFFMGLSEQGSAFGLFLLNSNAQEVALSPLPYISYRTIGGILDFFLFTGPKPADVIRQYYELLGKPPVPPYWSLGYHLCRYGLKNLSEVDTILERNLEANIPIESQWFDIDYMDSYKVWSVDNVKFEGLKQYVDEKLHKQLGMKIVIILDPAISTKGGSNYKIYEQGMKLGVYINDSRTNVPILGTVWPGETVFPDFAHPNALKWWSDAAKEFYEKNIPFDGLWIDMNEPANFNSGSLTGCAPSNKLDNPPFMPRILSYSLYEKTICPSAMHHDTTHYNRHNLYAYEQARVTWHAQKQVHPGKRPFLLSRSTFAGSGRYTTHWSGDVTSSWQSLKTSVAHMINFNMFGIPMVGADICGFVGNTTEELCIRWNQLGAFYPFSRTHNDDTSRHQDPASWSSDAVSAIREAIRTRYILLPYLYTLFYRSYLNGTTVARSLAFEFPQDSNTYTVDTQFMLGSCILVIPVLEQGKREVVGYVPAGEWIISSTAKRLKSDGEFITFEAPLSMIPVLFRAGCILPIQAEIKITSLARKQGFNLFVFLSSAEDKVNNCGSKADGELFWDDGESDKYEFVHIKFNVSSCVLRISIDESSKQHVSTLIDQNELKLSKVFILGFVECPYSVFVNKEKIDYEYIRENQIIVISFKKQRLLSDNLEIEWHI